MSVVKTAQKGVTIYNPTKFFRRYNLFSPTGSKEAFLMDMEGRFVNSWRLPYRPGAHGILLPNGHYFYAGLMKTRRELGWGSSRDFGGSGGVLMELDWDSNVVWQTEVLGQGHSFTVMPNGHIMYIDVSPKGILPGEIAKKVKGGRPGTELNGEIWGDMLVEIDRNGNRVWEWVAYEHLDFEIDTLYPLENRHQWPYINSVWVCRDGNVLASTRYLSQVTRIDHKTGKVIGRYGRGEISYQHDARELDNGNILIFDNGRDRHEYKPQYSRSVELDPKTDKVVWEYKANPPSDFFSAHSGGSERQPNGNTLINETAKGRAFEVTPKCEIVWEYVNPHYTSHRGRITNMIWRFHGYPCDYPGLKGKDLDPSRFAWLNRVWGSDAFAKDIKPCIF